MLLILLIRLTLAARRFRAASLLSWEDNFLRFKGILCVLRVNVGLDPCTLILEKLMMRTIDVTLIVFLLNYFHLLEAMISRRGRHWGLSSSLNSYRLRECR